MPTVENLNVSLNMQTANFSRGVQTAVSGLGKIGLASIGVNQILGYVRQGMDAFWSRIEKADKLGELAANLNMSGEELSRLQFAADRTDSSAEALTASLKYLAKTNPGLTFEEAVAELEALDDEMARAKRANELFGRSWVEINSLLRQGTANLQNMKNLSDALGETITEEQILNAQRLNDAWDNLTASVKSFGNVLVDFVSPTLTDMFNQWTKGVLEIRLALAELFENNELANKLRAAIAQVGVDQPGGGRGGDNPAEAARRASHRSGIGAAERFTVEGFSAAQQGQRRMEDLAKQQLNAQKQMAAGINQINGNLQNAIPVPAAL